MKVAHRRNRALEQACKKFHIKKLFIWICCFRKFASKSNLNFLVEFDRAEDYGSYLLLLVPLKKPFSIVVQDVFSLFVFQKISFFDGPISPMPTRRFASSSCQK
jgi:hypothetical protein